MRALPMMMHTTNAPKKNSGMTTWMRLSRLRRGQPMTSSLNTALEPLVQQSVKMAASGRLRRPHHVLARRHQLHGPPAELGPLRAVAPLARLGVELAEVRVGHVVHEAAHVAAPLAAVVDPGHEGVHVGAALLASDNSRTAEVDHIQGSILLGVEGHGLADDAQR